MQPFWLCIAAVLLLSAGLAGADPSQDKGKPDKSKPDKGVNVDVDLVLGGITAEVAREWAVEAGITGQKPLPPGIRKNLARGKPIPPGIAKTRMPDGYLARLPVHEGYRWEQMGTDLLLVHVATGLVSDLLAEVFG